MIYRDLDDDRETIPVRELLTDAYFSVNAARGWLYLPDRVADDVCELLGDRVSMRDVRPERYAGQFSHDPLYAELLELPAMCWGDYCGSAVERSNYRVVLDEYAGNVIDGHGDYSSACVYVPLDAEIPADLFDRLMGLSDYPLLDEDDYSALEMELEESDWSDAARHDLQIDVERTLDALEESTPGLTAEDFYLSDETADTLYSLARNSGAVSWACETAVNGYFRGLEDLAREYVGQVILGLSLDLESYARTLDNPYGGAQTVLPCAASAYATPSRTTPSGTSPITTGPTS